MRNILGAVLFVSLISLSQVARAEEIAEWTATQTESVIFTNDTETTVSHTTILTSNGNLVIQHAQSDVTYTVTIALNRIRRVDFDGGDFPIVIISAISSEDFSFDPPLSDSVNSDSWNLEFSNNDNATAQSVAQKLNALIQH